MLLPPLLKLTDRTLQLLAPVEGGDETYRAVDVTSDLYFNVRLLSADEAHLKLPQLPRLRGRCRLIPPVLRRAELGVGISLCITQCNNAVPLGRVLAAAKTLPLGRSVRLVVGLLRDLQALHGARHVLGGVSVEDFLVDGSGALVLARPERIQAAPSAGTIAAQNDIQGTLALLIQLACGVAPGPVGWATEVTKRAERLGIAGPTWDSICELAARPSVSRSEALRVLNRLEVFEPDESWFFAPHIMAASVTTAPFSWRRRAYRLGGALLFVAGLGLGGLLHTAFKPATAAYRQAIAPLPPTLLSEDPGRSAPGALSQPASPRPAAGPARMVRRSPEPSRRLKERRRSARRRGRR